jgi:hypothetical protein
MLGHAEAWFHEWLGGIQIDLTRPPPQQIAIRPTPVGDVTWARASHDSVLGRITSEWERSRGRFRLSVSVPARAVVHLPDGSRREIPAGSSTLERSLDEG